MNFYLGFSMLDDDEAIQPIAFTEDMAALVPLVGDTFGVIFPDESRQIRVITSRGFNVLPNGEVMIVLTCARPTYGDMGLRVK